jgi:hypothetical protein
MKLSKLARKPTGIHEMESKKFTLLNKNPFRKQKG